MQSVRCTGLCTCIAQPPHGQTGGLELHRHVCREMALPGTARSSDKVCVHVCVCVWKGCIRESSLHLGAVRMHPHPTLTLDIYGPFSCKSLKVLFLWPAVTLFGLWFSTETHKSSFFTCDVTELRAQVLISHTCKWVRCQMCCHSNSSRRGKKKKAISCKLDMKHFCSRNTFTKFEFFGKCI